MTEKITNIANVSSKGWSCSQLSDIEYEEYIKAYNDLYLFSENDLFDVPRWRREDLPGDAEFEAYLILRQIVDDMGVKLLLKEHIPYIMNIMDISEIDLHCLVSEVDPRERDICIERYGIKRTIPRYPKGWVPRHLK